MKFKTFNAIALTFTLLLLLTAPHITLADQSKQAQISELVRLLGYGGAVHNFKNFVIRGDEKYASKAKQYYIHAEETVASLQGADLSDEEKAALDDIRQMITKYLEVIDIVSEHYANSSFTILENDTIRVDDGPALAGLVTLRDGKQWNELEQIEYALGYGGAIHQYKNFVMHGQEEEQQAAASGFEQALTLFDSLAKADLNDNELKAVKDIQKAMEGYQKNLKKIEKTAKYIQKTKDRMVKRMAIHQADKKDNDEAALMGFEVLREKFAYHAD